MERAPSEMGTSIQYHTTLIRQLNDQVLMRWYIKAVRRTLSHIHIFYGSTQSLIALNHRFPKSNRFSWYLQLDSCHTNWVTCCSYQPENIQLKTLDNVKSKCSTSGFNAAFLSVLKPYLAASKSTYRARIKPPMSRHFMCRNTNYFERYVVCCYSHRGQADFSACLVWDIHSE